jgi:cytochrome o ubiquinol oxidase subunit II
VRISRSAQHALALVFAAAVSGCALTNAPVIDARGSAALAERDLLYLVSGLILIVVVPVFVLTVWFVWRYRAPSGKGRYTPEWSYSAPLDAVVWLVPTLIVACIAYLVWDHTHKLDPYRPIASASTPLEVDVIAQDWKWLFVYPEQDIAAVNELVFPSARPLRLKLTSDTVMNSFYVPGLVGQIFAMAGMRTELNVLASGPAEFVGRNTQFSGEGFADQQFTVRAATPAQFEAWVAQARRSPATLDAGSYAALAKPSRKVPPTYYSGVEPNLFARVIEKYKNPHRQSHTAATMTGAH